MNLKTIKGIPYGYYSSNECRIFWLRGVRQISRGGPFSRIESKFSIGRSPVMCGFLFKKLFKIIKNMKGMEKNLDKSRFFIDIFHFWRAAGEK